MGAHSKPLVGVHEKWRLSLNEACALCGIGETFLRQLLARGDFPPRVREGEASGGKEQFIAREVRAWADGEDWRALVKRRQEGVANAS